MKRWPALVVMLLVSSACSGSAVEPTASEPAASVTDDVTTSVPRTVAPSTPATTGTIAPATTTVVSTSTIVPPAPGRDFVWMSAMAAA